MRRSHRDDPETGAFPAERRFRWHNVGLRYVFEPAAERPDALIVAFSAAHERNEPPRYYTTRVLRAVPCHRLFILDDHGPQGTHPRPSWYLGRNRSQDVPTAVDELIRATTEELGLQPRRVFTCGASKGGWAAIYFAARLGAGHAVAGEPQAFLGQHLLQDGTWDIAAHVAGGTDPEAGDYLDALLFDALTASSAPPCLHLFCGRTSTYYDHDVLPLQRFLQRYEIPCELTLADYSRHVPDLGRHFPTYLTERLTKLIGEPLRLRPAAAPAPPSSPPGRVPA